MALLSQYSATFSLKVKPKSPLVSLLGSSVQIKKSISLITVPSSSSSSLFRIRCYSALSKRPIRYAVLGAGYAGLSVVWHLLQESPKESHLFIDIYDEVGFGGGASGVSGGLLHPYSPKVKLLWRGEECWKESLNLLRIAEDVKVSKSLYFKEQEDHGQIGNDFMVRRSGILRPAHSVKNMEIMIDNAQKGVPSCRIERIHKEAAHELIPGLYVPLDLAFHMPQALTVNSQCYLKALYSACQLSAKESPNSGGALKELRLHKKTINRLLDLAGEYDAVIICLGARAAFLPELSGRIPLRTCRGIIAHLKVDDDVRDGYPADSPSILSDAWIAFHGPQDLRVGATWDWNSRNYSRGVSREEGNKAIEELLHRKASAMYPAIKNMTTVTGMSGGLRAVPPLTPQGSLPLLGCVDEFVSGNQTDNKFWLLTGLGSRGLLYHGWVGKLMARAVLSRDEGLIPYELISWKSIL